MSLLAELDGRVDDEGIALCVREALVRRPQRPGRSCTDLLIEA
jgi:hypothetical protein